MSLSEIGLVLQIVLLAGAVALCADLGRRIWGEGPDSPEPDAVDGVELPNIIDLRVHGGRRPARARALEAERRAAQERP